MPEQHLITILHVDDDDANRYVHTRMLQKAGFEVFEATTGTEALHLMAEIKPDLIILDVMLPDIHGFEVCRRIKANPATASIPVLHLSANYVKSDDKVQGLESGADSYLVQPLEQPELIATVKALLRIRQAEQKERAAAGQWQATFDAISDGVCLLDEECRIWRCNESLKRILGKPSGEIIGLTWWELRQDVWGLDAEIACNSPTKTLCDRFYKTDNRQSIDLQLGKRWFCQSVHPIADEQQVITGAVLILTDISDRKSSEEQRAELLRREQAAREQAEAASRMKDEFLAIVSHELRSPLNAMLGWARLLRTRQLNQSTQERALETIERNATLQTNMIEDLLDISRIIRGKLRLSIHPVQLVFPIEAAIDTLRLAADAKGIRLESVLDVSAGVVSGDADRLQQVVWNLLSNAIKFTPPGGFVKVQLKHIDSYAQIQVNDSGIGISPDFLPYVFERFRQADGSMSRSYNGLGLGLAIVRQLVELHGGTVQAESPGEGQGANFTVKLPLLEGSREQREGRDVVSSDRNFAREGVGSRGMSDYSPLPILDGLRVLVVDDEADAREFISTVLEECSAVVTTAASVAEAMEAIAQVKPDVLVSDIGMPVEDGYYLIGKLRALEAEQGGYIPSVALTAYAKSEDRQRALTAGFQVHVAKPIEPAQLAAVVAELAGRSATSLSV